MSEENKAEQADPAAAARTWPKRPIRQETAEQPKADEKAEEKSVSNDDKTAQSSDQNESAVRAMVKTGGVTEAGAKAYAERGVDPKLDNRLGRHAPAAEDEQDPKPQQVNWDDEGDEQDA